MINLFNKVHITTLKDSRIPAYDFQKGELNIYFGKKYFISFRLEDFSYNNKSGLHLNITTGPSDNGGITFQYKHQIKIPLSFHFFYIMYIYPKTAKGKANKAKMKAAGFM